MLSARTLTVFALLAAVAAWPATNKPKDTEIIEDSDFFGSPDPWYSSFVGNLFGQFFNFFPKVSYQLVPKLTVDNDSFQITMKLDGFSKSDLKVKTKGCYVYIEGSHESKDNNDGIFSSSRMYQSFNLPENVSASDVKANYYSNGYLIVSAPVNGPADNEGVNREVPIEDIDAPYNVENKTKPEISTTPEATPVQEDDRKEPTTPASETEEPSVNDNSIPHGSETKS